jgi:1-deoxy-D-xylulose-5-phosphate reductoisomerase
MGVKNVVILGSTGSIGINTLKVVKRFPDHFKVVGLTAYSNFKLLEKQVQEFSPRYVAANPEGLKHLRKKVSSSIKFFDVETELPAIAALDGVDIVVIAISGSAALKPFLSAVRKGKVVAPANKEALVVAGGLIMSQARKHKATIIPIDSEQSAIFQCLDGRNPQEVKTVYLTASGGPLWNVAPAKFDKLSVAQILNHPRWKMGKRITVDSATLMNKGFEVIEAKWLFDLYFEQIQVVIHPEAIIHSMVGFKDGSIIAQLGVTDMRIPIQYALSYPKRMVSGLKDLDFFELKKLTFCPPDLKKFPALALAMEAAKQGGTSPSVLNAADENAVHAFLEKRLSFTQIYKVVEKVVRRHKVVKNPLLEDILAADRWAREEADSVISSLRR